MSKSNGSWLNHTINNRNIKHQFSVCFCSPEICQRQVIIPFPRSSFSFSKKGKTANPSQNAIKITLRRVCRCHFGCPPPHFHSLKMMSVSQKPNYRSTLKNCALKLSTLFLLLCWVLLSLRMMKAGWAESGEELETILDFFLNPLLKFFIDR